MSQKFVLLYIYVCEHVTRFLSFTIKYCVNSVQKQTVGIITAHCISAIEDKSTPLYYMLLRSFIYSVQWQVYVLYK